MRHAPERVGIDWSTWLDRLRRNDGLLAGARRQLATRLIGGARVVLDVGCGTGGTAVALAGSLPPGATLVLVDVTPELLEVATGRAVAAAGEGVEVRGVLADAGSDRLADLVPRADLVLASFLVHLLPDQQGAIDRLAALLAPGGRLALVQGGLELRCLPWDLGVGEPGLAGRLTTAHGEWFRALRAGLDGAVRMPYGWDVALARAGLVDVASHAYLVDEPAPASDPVRDAVVGWLAGVRDLAAPWLSAADLRTVELLLDPEGPHHVGRREDVFLLVAHTVHQGRRRP